VVPPAMAEASGSSPEVVVLPPRRPDIASATPETGSESSPDATSAVKPTETPRPRSAPRRREADPGATRPGVVQQGATAATPTPSAGAPPPDGGSPLQRGSRNFTDALTCLFTPGCFTRDQVRQDTTGAIGQSTQAEPSARPVQK
jgi:hypothetical protein